MFHGLSLNFRYPNKSWQKKKKTEAQSQTQPPQEGNGIKLSKLGVTVQKFSQSIFFLERKSKGRKIESHLIYTFIHALYILKASIPLIL